MQIFEKMRFVAILFTLAGVACGAGGADANDPAKIVVPVQPPQLVVAAPLADASAPPPASPAPPVPFTCEGGVKLATPSARAYCAYADPMSWTDAEKRCVTRGGHLVSLGSKDAIDALRAGYGNPLGVPMRGAWIGLEVVNKSKKQWKWSTGEAVKFERWNDGEPNDFDGHESCGELLVANGKWNDTRCELEQGFLCQQVGQRPLDCKDGRALPSPPGKYCYVGEPTSYASAKKSCAKRGGALASLVNEDAAKEIAGSMEQRFKVPRFWIGLNDLTEQGTWMWPDGSHLRRGDWKPGEPNNYGREGCVELYTDSWRWNDLDCNAELPSICEGPPGPAVSLRQ